MSINPNIRILVVDDSSTMRTIIKSALRDHGLNNILEADDGDIALDIVQNQEVDLILCDWLMNRMHGIEVLRTMKSSRELDGIPFIMITSETQQENVVIAVKDGANNYLVKPFQPEQLMDKIEKTMKN